ncbi:MAG: entericidin EcnAB [Pseudomonadota bacterium]
MRKITTVVIVAFGMALGACNTVKGAGEDITSVGEAGERAIN